MKILYHHRTLSRDGQDVHIAQMVAALERRGHELIVVGPAADEGGRGERRVAMLRRRLPRAIGESMEMAYSLAAWRRLEAAWRRHRPDLLYERHNLFLMAGPWLKRKTGIPYLLEVNAPLAYERGRHGGLFFRHQAERIEHAVWRAADMVLPVTARLAEFVRLAGVPDERMEVICNGVDRRRFAPGIDGTALRRRLGIDDKVVLGFVGFIRAWHGLVRVADAMAHLNDLRDLHLLVAGDGPARQELEERARALGLADRVTVMGVVPHDEMPEVIAAFDVALQPCSVAYASPLKLFEYMAMGKAVVAPALENIREVVRHGEDAWLFDPVERGGLEKAIAELATNPALRQRLGEGASRSVDKRGYTWDGNAERVERLALALLGRKTREMADQ
ncbi:MAG: glycosyltransferase family 4 protein [Alphaproteobacteria bacterium]|nr:glycosyltransferase family 4 protein [Alphaproteobacteria bacterium]